MRPLSCRSRVAANKLALQSSAALVPAESSMSKSRSVRGGIHKILALVWLWPFERPSGSQAKRVCNAVPQPLWEFLHVWHFAGR